MEKYESEGAVAGLWPRIAFISPKNLHDFLPLPVSPLLSLISLNFVLSFYFVSALFPVSVEANFMQLLCNSFRYTALFLTAPSSLAAMDHWHRALGSGHEICTIFFDYNKAFDLVPHRPLLDKLRAVNVSPYILKWIAVQQNAVRVSWWCHLSTSTCYIWSSSGFSPGPPPFQFLHWWHYSGASYFRYHVFVHRWHDAILPN